VQGAAHTIWDLDQLSGGRYHSLAEAAVADAAPATAPALAGAGHAAAVPGPPAAGGGVTAEARSRQTAAGRAVADAGWAVPAAGISSGGGLGGTRGMLLAPGTTIGCRIAMGVTMAFMLLIMI
jgi:hypothetical protein